MGGIGKYGDEYQKEIEQNLNEVYKNIDSARTRAYKIRKINVDPKPTKEEMSKEIISKLECLSETQLEVILNQIRSMGNRSHER